MFGITLEKIMKNNNIKVKDLAISADITEGYISDIKKGRSLPRKNKLDLILEALKLTISEENELIFLWEKESSPISFVQKYEKLENENNRLKEIINNPDSILLIENKDDEINLLRKEIESLKKYKELLNMLNQKDLKLTLERILRDIELEMRQKNIFKENKKDFESIKKEMEDFFFE